MRTTVSGSFGPDFFKIFSRKPGEITITFKDGETVSGNTWVLFAQHLTLEGLEVAYDQIATYTAKVDMGSPFGQYLTERNDDPAWTFWSQRCDIEWFIEHLLGGEYVKFSMVDPSSETFVEGKVFTVSADTIMLASGAIRVDRRRILWVCHKLSQG